MTSSISGSAPLKFISDNVDRNLIEGGASFLSASAVMILAAKLFPVLGLTASAAVGAVLLDRLIFCIFPNTLMELSSPFITVKVLKYLQRCNSWRTAPALYVAGIIGTALCNSKSKQLIRESIELGRSSKNTSELITGWKRIISNASNGDFSSDSD